MVRARWERWVEWCVALVLVVVVLGPVLGTRGFVLIGDMVFVPDQPWKDAWTGGDGGVPRAVPADAVVSVLSTVLGGELLQRLVLALPLLAGFLGMTRLLAALPLMARLAGALCFVWSPYVLERLAIGHWGLMCGYAALPWVAWATLRLRAAVGVKPGEEQVGHDRRAFAVLVAALFVAAWSSPTGALLALGVGIVLAWGRRRLVLVVTAIGVVVNLPWLMPAFLNGAEQLAPDAFGARAFASAADTPWGVLGSLFTFGGIWKVSIMPAVRGEWFFAVVALLVAVVALVGLWRGHRDGPAGRVLPRGPAFVLAAAGMALAGAGSWDVTRGAVEWAVVHLPGGGLLRDSQKWVAWWALPAAVGFACAAARLTQWVVRSGGGRAGAVQVGLCVVLLPVLALPTFAWGMAGVLSSAEYPDDWSAVRDEMERLDVDDDLVVALPFSTYRQFDWNPRPALDPVSRHMPGSNVLEDALTVDSGTVGGESPLAARIREASSPDELTEVLLDAGVRWVLVHTSTTDAVLPSGATTVLDTEQLDLLSLPERGSAAPSGAGWRAPVYAGVDLAVLVLSSIVVIRGLTSRNSSQYPR